VLEKRPRWGFWKCYDRLRLDGRQWNHKRVRRMYRSLGLNLPRRTKRRPPRRPLQILEAPATLNRVWALDFMHDRLYGSGRSFRTLNVVDEANRKGLAIEVGTSIPAARVVRVMEQLDEMYGLPSTVRVDNGPEFLAEAFQSWCLEHGIEIRYIQPGKPNQNAYVERFNKSYREEILDAYLFETSTRRSSSRTSGCSTTTTSGRTTRSEDSLRRATCRGPQPWIRLLSRCVLDGARTL
jgi:putative transposase